MAHRAAARVCFRGREGAGHVASRRTRGAPTGLPSAVDWKFTFGAGCEFYGKLSVVGERTYANGPPLVGNAEYSFLLEDLYVGWRSGKASGADENVLDFTVGRAPYTIGHRYLVWDGTAEGGSRRGYCSNVA